jgi:DNA polymerase (family 10)
MDNKQIAGILQAIGQILEIQDENPFKVRAYAAAARTLEALSVEVRSLVEQKTLGELPGIGPALEEKITQLVTTGRMKYYDDLRKGIPAGVLEMLRIPTVGPKKVKVLWKELGVTSLEALREACDKGRLVDLKGFGERTQEKILQGLAFLSRHAGQFLLARAMPVARRLLGHLEACRQIQRVSLAGSLRRWKEIVKDVDLLASSKEPDKVMDHFVRAEGVAEVLARGDTKTSVRLEDGLQVDLRVVTDGQFPSALAYFTGSKEHNVAVRGLAQRKGLKVNEYGIFKGARPLPCRDEQEFYGRLGLPYIPPEMRENTGEVDLASVPRLVERGDLKGTFHTHSTWSDGTAGIREMAEKARSMGLEYMGLSDHSKAASYANGLDEARLARQLREVDKLNEGWKDFRILKGLECDILPSGDLDLTPAILSRLDFVIGSVHSRFDMTEREMTDRVCKALSNKHLSFLGHPTGRLLLEREGYRIDLESILTTAREEGKIVELNANPNRLDLDWVHCRRARELGMMVSINPDAHSTQGLEDIEYGVATARRAWLQAKDILNTRGRDEVLKILSR